MPDRHHAASRGIVQAQAISALIKIIRHDAVDDDELTAFLASLDTDADRKASVNHMLSRGCISDEQASFAVYLHPGMRGA